MTRRTEDRVWVGVFLALASLCIVFCGYVGKKEMQQAMNHRDQIIASAGRTGQ